MDLSELSQTPFFQRPENPDEEATPWKTNMQLSVQLDKLSLNPKKPIEKIIINAKRQNKVWQALQVEAFINAPLLLVYKPKKRILEGVSDDFGALLLALNVSDKFVGGHLKLQAEQDEEGVIQGKILTEETELMDPSFLVQALSIFGIVDAIRGKNMELDEIHVPFELKPEGDLVLDDGYATGSGVGLTFKGTVNLSHVAIAGSVIPAYFVNSLPGKIPLIGALFRDGDGGGLLSVKYSVHGKPTEPEVEIHPLSSMAPGALGYIF